MTSCNFWILTDSDDIWSLQNQKIYANKGSNTPAIHNQAMPLHHARIPCKKYKNEIKSYEDRSISGGIRWQCEVVELLGWDPWAY
jgi:hypothetical protein